jgi:DNA-binding transcriptional regulator LsrR (DeoR family)
MTDQPSALSQRAEAQAKAKARQAKRVERREAFFDLVASGYSHRQIATAMGVSLATVHREVDKALAERPIHAPEHYLFLQVARLTKALSYADLKLERATSGRSGPT